MRLPWKRGEEPETRALGAAAPPTEGLLFSPTAYGGGEGANHPFLASARAFIVQLASNLRIDPELPPVSTPGFPSLGSLMGQVSLRVLEGERVVVRVERRAGRIVRLHLVKAGSAMWRYDPDTGTERLLLSGRAPSPGSVIALVPEPRRSAAYGELIVHASRYSAGLRASTRDLGGVLVLKREATASGFLSTDTAAETSQGEQIRLDEASREGAMILPPGIAALDRVAGDEQAAGLQPMLKSLSQEVGAFYGLPAEVVRSEFEPQHLRLAASTAGARLATMWRDALTPMLGFEPQVSPAALKVSDPVQLEAIRTAQIASVNEVREAMGLPRHDDPAADNPLQPVTGTAQPRREDAQG